MLASPHYSTDLDQHRKPWYTQHSCNFFPGGLPSIVGKRESLMPLVQDHVIMLQPVSAGFPTYYSVFCLFQITHAFAEANQLKLNLFAAPMARKNLQSSREMHAGQKYPRRSCYKRLSGGKRQVGGPLV